MGGFDKGVDTGERFRVQQAGLEAAFFLTNAEKGDFVPISRVVGPRCSFLLL
jgi:hypothetical protein